jgi:branched-chain amino acid transport system ATP-binding protein
MNLLVENLNVSYGKVQVLWDVTFKVDKGTLVSIIGPNGAGKTTLIKTISGLLKPFQGKIIFGGENIAGKPPHLIKKLGISTVPEGRGLFPNLTVRENLIMGSYVIKDKRKIEDALKFVYDLFPILSERGDQLAGSLSGGEAQMLSIGRALMSAPKMLLFDEPSLGLAPMIVERMFDVIKTLKGRGITILLVEQHVQHALELADYSYILENGRIVLEGEGKELLENPHLKRHYLGL